MVVELKSSARAKREQGCERVLPFGPPSFYRISQVSGPERVDYRKNHRSNFPCHARRMFLGLLGFGSDGLYGPPLASPQQALGFVEPGTLTAGSPWTISMSVAPEGLVES